MKSPVVKRSIVIGGHKTSVSLEDQFWTALKQIAKERSLTLSELVAEVDGVRGENANLSSAIRLFVLAHFRARCRSPSSAQAPDRSEPVPQRSGTARVF